MKGRWIVLLVALATIFACANGQDNSSSVSEKPSICDQDSGKWDPYHINCDFDCDGDGWEIKCKCDKKSDKCDEIDCKIDRDGAPDEEDIEFTCTSNGDGENPACDLPPITADLTTCVAEKVTTVLESWIVGVSE